MGYAFCGVVEYAVDLVGTKNLRVVEYDINDILHRTRTRYTSRGTGSSPTLSLFF